MSRPGVPLTPIPKKSVKVHIELTKEEFVELKLENKWNEVRSNALRFLQNAVNDLVPRDMIIEHAKKVYWAR